MSGAEYEPQDSRNVTLTPNEPGKPSGWRERDAASDPGSHGELEPEDSRHVTEEGIPKPGEQTGWREKQAEGREPDLSKIPSGEHQPPPDGVPQEGRPFTAEEAAEGNQPS